MPKRFSIALGILCLTLHGFAYSAGSLDLSRMTQRYERNCPNLANNYSYQKLKEYAAELDKAERAGTKREVGDVTEQLALNNSDFIKFEVKTPACALAMAENLIEGMTYYRSARPETAFSYTDTSRHIAFGYLWNWLLGPEDGRSANLAHSDKAMRQYLNEDDGSYKPEQRLAYMFAAEGYRELARVARTPADGLTLLDRAIAFAEEGLEVASDKSEALFSARHVYSDKIGLLQKVGEDSSVTAGRALHILQPHIQSHGEVGVLIAEYQLQLRNTTVGKAQLEWVTQHKDAAEAFCSFFARGLVEYSYPAIHRYLKAEPEWAKDYVDATCDRGGKIKIPLRKSVSAVVTEPEVRSIIATLESHCPNRRDIPQYEAFLKVGPENESLKSRGILSREDYGGFLMRWFALGAWKSKDKNCTLAATREALHTFDFYLEPTPAADFKRENHLYRERAEWRIKSISVGESIAPVLDVERASDDYFIFLALLGSKMEVERTIALESIASDIIDSVNDAFSDSNARLIANVGVQQIAAKLPDLRSGRENLAINLERLLRARDKRTPKGTPQWREQLVDGIRLLQPYDIWRYELSAFIAMEDMQAAKRVIVDRIAKNTLTADDCVSSLLRSRSEDVVGFRTQEAEWFAAVVEPYCNMRKK